MDPVGRVRACRLCRQVQPLPPHSRRKLAPRRVPRCRRTAQVGRRVGGRAPTPQGHCGTDERNGDDRRHLNGSVRSALPIRVRPDDVRAGWTAMPKTRLQLERGPIQRNTSSSTIAKRTGSPSAACRVAVSTRSHRLPQDDDNTSIDIESNVMEFVARHEWWSDGRRPRGFGWTHRRVR